MIPAFGDPQPFEPPDLAGGLVDTPHPGAYPPNAGAVLVNAEFRNLALQRRFGRHKYGTATSTHPRCQGIFAYRPISGAGVPSNQFVFAQAATGVAETYLYEDSGATSRGVVSNANPATDPADLIGSNASNERVGGFVQANNYLFYWDGGAVRKKYFGPGSAAITDWGYQGTALTAGTSGALAPGGAKTVGKEYFWVWTLYSSTTGEETNPSPISAPGRSPTTGNQQFDATIPTTSSWTSYWDKIRLYSTFGDGEGLYYFEREVNAVNLDLGPQTITNGMSKADSELGAEVQFDNNPPPQTLYLMHFDGRIIAVDAEDPTSVVYSKKENPHSFPPVNKIYIEKDGGDTIAGLFDIGDGRLYAVNRIDGVYMLTPSVGDTFQVEKVASNWGCVDHNSIVSVGGFGFWIDVKGAIKFDGHNITNISDRQIRQTFNRFKPYMLDDGAGNFTGAAGAHDKQPDRDYCRWLMHDVDEGVNYHLIYDLPREAWLLHRPGPTTPTAETGISDRCFGRHVREDTGEIYTLVGDDEGRRYQMNITYGSNNPIYNDAAEDFQFRWRSPWYGTGYEDMLLLWVDFEYERSDSGKTDFSFEVEIYRDGDETPDQTQAYALYDTGKLRKRARMIASAKTCERVAVGFKLDGSESDLKIMNLKLYAAEEGIKVLGA